MKNKKNYLVLGFVVFIVICIFALPKFLEKKESSKESKNNADSITMEINTDDDDEKIDWSKYETVSYELSKSLTITKEGVYQLTGTIEDGVITINTSGNVKLVLDNVRITNSNGPAIYVQEAEDVVISTVSGSMNYLEDGSSYKGYDTDVIGTIFSHDDITFEGEGTLVVTSNCEDAIVSKDDLKIVSGTYQITSADDGIRGKDSVYIKNGTFKIEAKGMELNLLMIPIQKKGMS